ncbi:lysophospholipid acyltransferase family protein [Elusimicrobiota bacterium]
MIYWIGRTLYFIFFKLFFRFKVSGKENLPEGGFIVASNHNSLTDPPFIGCCIPRSVYFMAKKELFKIPFLGRIIRHTHAFPVDRHTPGPSTLKTALKLLQSGKIVLVFPRGTRKSRGKLYNGAAVLAHKSALPVVPARIYNNENIFKLMPLSCRFGEPVSFPVHCSEKASSEQYSEFTRLIMEKSESL